MFLVWYEDGLRGATPQMPAVGYKWSETPRLNVAIWEKNRSRSQAMVMDDFESGYRRILEIVDALSGEQLASFHCTHAKRTKVAVFTVRTSFVPPRDFEVAEFQFAGSTEAHVVPIYRAADIPILALR